MCFYWWFTEVLFETVLLYVSRSLQLVYPHEENSLFSHVREVIHDVGVPRRWYSLFFCLKADLCATLVALLHLWPSRRSFLEVCLLLRRSSSRYFWPSLQRVPYLCEVCGLPYEVRCLTHLFHGLACEVRCSNNRWSRREAWWHHLFSRGARTKALLGSLKHEGSDLVGTKAYLLLKQHRSCHLIMSFYIGWLKGGVGYDEYDERPSYRIALHVAHADWSDVTCRFRVNTG